ncbi:MAG: hypothetical protein P8Q52_14175 [Acidimicrobiales bacterium]|nr:hypothetical protein [Acidimicrobiales bacterium]
MPSPRIPRYRTRSIGRTSRIHRPHGRIILAMVLAVLVAIPATAAGAAVRQGEKVSSDQAFNVLQIDANVPVSVKLGCRGNVDEGIGTVGCRWRAIDDQAIASWQLLNLQLRPEAGVRNLVAELGAHTRSFRDTNVEVPAAYVYAVLALDAEGEVIGRSRVVDAAVHNQDREIEPLYLRCDGHRGEAETVERGEAIPDISIWTMCEWRPSTSDSTAGYVVWRTTDVGGRIAIARTGLDQTTIRDNDVSRGHRYRYVVQAVDADGNTVGLSRPANVAFRPHDRTPDREIGHVTDREIEVQPERRVEARLERDLVRDR